LPPSHRPFRGSWVNTLFEPAFFCVRGAGGLLRKESWRFDSPLGPVQYRYQKDQSNGWRYEIILPEQAEGCLILQDGKHILFTGKLEKRL
jgi:hypothetical protein